MFKIAKDIETTITLGGALALALAIQVPGHINRLVLMGSLDVRFEMTEGNSLKNIGNYLKLDLSHKVG